MNRLASVGSCLPGSGKEGGGFKGTEQRVLEGNGGAGSVIAVNGISPHPILTGSLFQTVPPRTCGSSLIQPGLWFTYSHFYLQPICYSSEALGRVFTGWLPQAHSEEKPGQILASLPFSLLFSLPPPPAQCRSLKAPKFNSSISDQKDICTGYQISTVPK